MSFTQDEINAMVQKLELDGKNVSSIVEGRAFINGKYVESKSGEWLTSQNPSSGKTVAKIASCDEDDVNDAVIAARSSFESGCWSNMPPNERKNILVQFANLIQDNLLEFSVYDCIEAGKAISDNLEGDVPDTVECFKYHAECINKLYDQVAPTGSDKLGLIVREPVGVVGLIVPWNFPLLMAAWKLAPALATGNSCILKPSELTSLSAIRLGQIANEAGIPPGVLNIVPGLGAKAGAAISSHMDINMCGFTGSTVTGRLVLKASSESNLKRVSLELGGKSPQVVFDDIEDIDKVIGSIMDAAFWNQSENCSCGSRLIVQKSIKAKIMEKLLEKIEAKDEWNIGDPIELDTNVGSMISPQHMDKVMGYIKKGKEEGATLVIGGNRVLESSGGDFVELTIFDNVKNDMSIAQNEIFGPVLCVIDFETEEEAIAIANDTKYGLAASLYTSNVHRALRVSKKLRAGNVSVNCFAEGDDTTPFGGYKQSGFAGHDKSIHAHEQYQELKTIWHDIYQ